MATKGRTKDDFIKKASAHHSEKGFAYPHIESMEDFGDRESIIIICPTHGEFTQNISGHLRGGGCRKCSDAQRSINQKGKSVHSKEHFERISKLPRPKRQRTKEDFLEKANIHHSEKGYEYPNLEVVTDRAFIDVICPTHGLFNLNVGNHLRGNGCAKCASSNTAMLKKIRVNQEEIIEKLNEVHQGNEYTYINIDSLEFLSDTIQYNCPTHGLIEQELKAHLNGSKCKFCSAIENGRVNKIYHDEFLIRANEAHKHRHTTYQYPHIEKEINNNGVNSKITIICSQHGEYSQSGNEHLNGRGCPKCAMGINQLADGMDKNYRFGKENKIGKMTKEIFIERARTIHGDKYGYDLSMIDENTTFTRQKFGIICNVHGTQLQLVESHLYQKSGCPKCKSSNGEMRIGHYFENVGVIYEVQKTFTDLVGLGGRKLPFDFYIPSKNLLIEFDGLQHSKAVKFSANDTNAHDRYIKQIEHDKMKTDYAKLHGYEFIRATESELDNLFVTLSEKYDIGVDND